jgi:endonuclease/exonuclease/phosphatase family metal-dependent hydrolase
MEVPAFKAGASVRALGFRPDVFRFEQDRSCSIPTNYISVNPLFSTMLAWLLVCGPCNAGNFGKLRILTYNVAGLPEGLSAVRPTRNLPRIGALLGPYDLVLIQEDFAYPELLRKYVGVTYASPMHLPSDDGTYGDGLTFFARYPFTVPARSAWTSCHGVVDSYFDCLTRKGYAFTTMVLGTSLRLHVYNVHLDAGGSPADLNARRNQVAQLLRSINEQSAGEAIILGGDFNFSRSERDVLAHFEQESGLVDVCKRLRCAHPDRLDRVLVRGSNALRLTPRRWHVDTRFRNAQGGALSDHLAVAVDVEWAFAERS